MPVNLLDIANKNGDSVILYGAGKYGRIALKNMGLKYPKVCVRYFVDDDLKRNNKDIEGIQVTSLNNAVAQCDGRVTIVITNFYIKETLRNIERAGIDLSQAIQLYNGIDEKLYYHPIQNREDKKCKKQLMIAGNISDGKGQWDAIRAVEILVQKGICVYLNIVGEGERRYVSSLKTYVMQKNIEKNITFIPYTNNLMQLRLDSDAVLVCSKMEAFGRVTAEAMMAGKIVIGSSSGGTSELIGEHEERGYLYTWNNPEELAEKIEYVLTHPGEVLEKEKRAQDFILKLTDLDTYTDKLKGIYHKIFNMSNNRL